MDNLHSRALILTALSALGLALPLVSPSWSNSHNWLTWLLDLLTHWQGAFVFTLALSLLVTGFRQHRYLLLLPLGLLPTLTPSPSAPNAGGHAELMTVASTNVSWRNEDPAPLIAWLATVKPDIVVLLELSPGFTSSIEGLSDYPHRKLIPQANPFGIGVLSRMPLENIEIHSDPAGVPWLKMTTVWKQKAIELFAIHPTPPITPANQAHRNALLQTIAHDAGAQSAPTIVAGDINATPWSSAFLGLPDKTLLRATGLLPTWPSIGLGVFGIPIDHVLVSSHWSVASAEVGPNIGSDHYPIVARLKLRRDEKKDFPGL